MSNIINIKSGRRSSRRSTSRKNSTTTKKDTPGTQALKLVKKVISTINVETKLNMLSYVGVSGTSAGSIYCLSSFATGDTELLRTGNSILPKYLELNGYCAWNASNTDVPSYFRVILFRDFNDVSDTQPILANLLETVSSPGNAISQYNHYLDKRFLILDDILIPVNLYHPLQPFKIHRDFNSASETKWHITFNGAASADISKNHLYVVFVGSGTTNTNTFGFTTKLGYTDN